MVTFAILISTKDRCDELLFTLNTIQPLLNNEVVCVVYDDGSKDSTIEKVKVNFPQIILKSNRQSKGYIYCRNKMLNETRAQYAISLDDDANFIGDNPLELISKYFSTNPKCGLIASRIFWTKNDVFFSQSNEKECIVKSFVGCGHIWRMEAWNDIPNYPEWYEFYGEETFASLQLFKKKWQVHYLPEILVQHRVNLIKRAQNRSQFSFRLRRSLRSDWFNYILFFPLFVAVKCLMFSICEQLKKILIKGDFKTFFPLLFAICDFFIKIPKLVKNRNSLSRIEYENYLKLKEAKIYWIPEK